MTEIVAVESDQTAFEEEIGRLLQAHAEAAGSPFDTQYLYLKAVGDDGATLGGLTGFHQLGWLYIDLLAVVPEARGRGTGRDLVRRAEAIAVERGLSGVWLGSYAFQAPEFYLRLGYREFGRLPAVEGQPGGALFCKLLKEETP